jgi:hypothetical protein
MISLQLKGKWSTSRRQGFHSTLSVSFTLCLTHRHPIGINLHSYPLFSKGGENRPRRGRIIRPLKFLHFWHLMQRGKVLGPKQKDCTTSKRTAPPYHFQIQKFQLVSVSKVEIISITKTLLTAKGRTFSGGAFV